VKKPPLPCPSASKNRFHLFVNQLQKAQMQSGQGVRFVRFAASHFTGMNHTAIPLNAVRCAAKITRPAMGFAACILETDD
jgi:hypothetical protein